SSVRVSPWRVSSTGFLAATGGVVWARVSVVTRSRARRSGSVFIGGPAGEAGRYARGRPCSARRVEAEAGGAGGRAAAANAGSGACGALHGVLAARRDAQGLE